MSSPSPTVYLIGLGSSITITPAGGSASTIGGATQISFSGSKLDLEDVSSFSSPNGYHEWAPTLKDAGNATIQGHYNSTDAGQLATFAAFDASPATLCAFVVQFPKSGTETTTGPSVSFSGYISERPSRTVAFDKTVTYSVTIKITGAFTETAGS
jgi:hypothetical protein